MEPVEYPPNDVSISMHISITYFTRRLAATRFSYKSFQNFVPFFGCIALTAKCMDLSDLLSECFIDKSATSELVFTLEYIADHYHVERLSTSI